MAKKKVEVDLDGAKKTVEVKAPPKKQCSIKDALPESVIALVRAAPNNDTIRSLLLAHLKVPVPKEEDSFDKIKEWIEFNVAPPPKPKTAREIQEEEYARQIAESQRIEAERRRHQVMVQVTASDREHGRCSYHNDRRGTGQMPFHREELIDCAANAESGADFFSRVADFLSEENPSDYITLSDVGGTQEYDDHEFDETTNTEVSIDEAGKTALKEALRNANEALFNELFPNG